MIKPGDLFILQNVVPGVKSIEVIFRFIQLGFEHLPESPMYDLVEQVGMYPAETTLSHKTLEGLGYVFPKDAP